MSFACYICFLHTHVLGLVAMIFTLITPFFCYRLLRSFRDEGLGGVISFGRGWGYVVFLVFYASLLFAVAQFIYFAYIDKGFFMQSMREMMEAPEMVAAAKQMGFADGVSQTINMMASMRPIDLVLNILTSNLLIGCIMGVPIAAIAKRSPMQQAK